MRKIDLYWMSNREWYTYDENLIPIIKDDAPTKAKISYERYIEQTKKAS